MKKYRLAIFDLDGTLSNSYPWFIRIVNDVADTFSFRRVDDPDALRGLTSREILRRLDVPLWKLPRIASHMRRIKAKAIGQIPLFPGVEGALRTLASKGVVLAIVSSDSEANARAALGGCAGLISFFDCGASLFGKAGKFRRVVKRAGVSPAITIGDEGRDAEAAAEAGIAFGAVAWGYARLDALEAFSPARVFQRIEDLTSIG